MSRYRVEVARSVEKELLALPTQVYDTAKARLLSLEEQPRPHGCKKLKGVEHYRLRHGDYRVVYAIDDRSRTVTILSIAHRKDVYR